MDALRAAIAASDYVIVPCDLSSLDARGTLETLEAVVRPVGVPYRVLLTRTRARWPQKTEEYRTAFEDAGHPTFRTTIGDREALRACIQDGIPIGMTKLSGMRAAREDYQALATEYLAEAARLARGGLLDEPSCFPRLHLQGPGAGDDLHPSRSPKDYRRAVSPHCAGARGCPLRR